MVTPEELAARVAKVEDRSDDLEVALFGPAEQRRRGDHSRGVVAEVTAIRGELIQMHTELTGLRRDAVEHSGQTQGVRRTLQLVAALVAAQAALIGAIVGIVQVMT